MDDDKKAAKFDDVDQLSLKGIEQSVKVVRVVDGNACYVIADYHRQLVKFKCRLMDIDCAELKQGSLDVNGRDGWSARDFLVHLSMGGDAKDFDETKQREDKNELERKLNGSQTLIYATFGDFDCFGRVLVTLKKEKSSEKSFSQILDERCYTKDQRDKTRPIHE